MANGYWNDASGRVVGEAGLQTSVIAEDSQNYGLTLDWQAGARTSAQARAYYSRFDELSDGALVATGRVLARDQLFEQLGKLDASLAHVVGERQLLQAGAELWWNEYSGANRLRDDLAGDSVSTRVLWAQDRIRLGSRLALTLGGRFDDHSSFGSAFSPKVGLNLRAAEALRLRASYGRGFRAPDPGQLYYRFFNPTNLYQVIGNPSLQPEHAQSVQLGAEIAPRNGRVRFGINAFHNDVRELIESVNLGFVATPAQLQALVDREGIDPSFRPAFGRPLFLYKNVNDVATQGLELDGEAKLVGGFTLAGAYTYLDARDDVTGLRLTNRNQHQGFARLAFENARLGLRANARGTFFSSWIVSRTTSAAGLVETVAPGFTLVDFYVAQRLVRGCEAYAAIDNVADSKDPNVGGLAANGQPLPIYRAEVGRSFRVGLQLSLDKGERHGPRR